MSVLAWVFVWFVLVYTFAVLERFLSYTDAVRIRKEDVARRGRGGAKGVQHCCRLCGDAVKSVYYMCHDSFVSACSHAVLQRLHIKLRDKACVDTVSLSKSFVFVRYCAINSIPQFSLPSPLSLLSPSPPRLLPVFHPSTPHALTFLSLFMSPLLSFALESTKHSAP